MTRPCGPVPSMRPRSMPASFASRRAKGEEKFCWCRRRRRRDRWSEPPHPHPLPSGERERAALAAVAETSPLGELERLSKARRLAGRLLLPEGEKVGMRGLRRWGFRRRAPCCRRSGFHVLAFLRHHGDELIDRHVVGAFRHHDLGHDAVIDGLVFHGRLVGLDLGDDVAGLDRVAFLLEPLGRGCPSPSWATAPA